MVLARGARAEGGHNPLGDAAQAGVARQAVLVPHPCTQHGGHFNQMRFD